MHHKNLYDCTVGALIDELRKLPREMKVVTLYYPPGDNTTSDISVESNGDVVTIDGSCGGDNECDECGGRGAVKCGDVYVDCKECLIR